jgi:enamine deaminase RidA (YjgF/YER057c/UK114 family)
MDGPLTTPHTVVSAPELPPGVGYAHAIAAAAGRLVHIAGQVAQGPDGGIVGATLAEQFDVAASNVVAVLRAAGGEAPHIVSILVFVTDVAEYRESRSAFREVWQRHFGKHYPAMAVVGVTELVDPRARVELVVVAVVP